MNCEIQNLDANVLNAHITQDEESEFLKWDNLGTMMCWHQEYNLGEKHEMSLEEGKTVARNIETAGGIVLPLFLFDHNGITLCSDKSKNTTLSWLWDSCQVGFIFVRAERICKQYGVNRVTKKVRERATACLISEVHACDKFLSGRADGFENCLLCEIDLTNLDERAAGFCSRCELVEYDA